MPGGLEERVLSALHGGPMGAQGLGAPARRGEAGGPLRKCASASRSESGDQDLRIGKERGVPREGQATERAGWIGDVLPATWGLGKDAELSEVGCLESRLHPPQQGHSPGPRVEIQTSAVSPKRVANGTECG